jgi:predicted AlkP superfamily pyrophosphatase or phosphodiesterase
MRKILLLVGVLLCLVTAPSFAQKPVHDLKPTVILISLDGFRWDYLDRYKPPALNEMARSGVRAKWMIPSFPTKTFPNHYTIATGLYPSHHGIVENNVYDFGVVFTMSKREEVRNPRWWWGEPIWNTAEKQGQVAASYFWPGTETMIGGDAPTFWRGYNGRVPPEMRVDKTLERLDLPVDKRPTMITLYFSDTDDAGHEFSPESEETGYAVQNVDRYIERLIKGLKKRKIDKKVNIIIVSDHGMAPVTPKNVTFLDDYFDFDKLTDKILWTNEIVQIFPLPSAEDKIFASVKDLKHTTCWRKKDIPARLHYNEGRRIAPIVCSSEEGWMTSSHKRYDEWYKDENIEQVRGAHGYDNRYQSMQATFIARGPAFKRGYVAEPFENVEVYNVMCKILGLKPAKNDGDIERVKGMLR